MITEIDGTEETPSTINELEMLSELMTRVMQVRSFILCAGNCHANFCWTEQEWREKTAGSAIRRIGFERWLRNLAVALGNAETNDSVLKALRSREHSDSSLVREHVGWALSQHRA